MTRDFRIAVMMLVLFTGMTGVMYPLIITGIAQLIFPWQANGSLLHHDGKTTGSALIGQPFSGRKYFWSRPSATVPFAYNAASSSGSNYGPLNPALLNAVQKRVTRLKEADPDNRDHIPVDLVTSSGSGLDPHISIAAALYQVPRVALERHIPEGKIRSLVEQFTAPRGLGVLGEPGVNVLRLNLALDEMTQGSK